MAHPSPSTATSTSRRAPICTASAIRTPSQRAGSTRPLAHETPFKQNAIAGVRALPGRCVREARREDPVQGRVLRCQRPRSAGQPAPRQYRSWSLPLPPKTPAGAQPPALQGTINGGVLTLAAMPTQQGYVDFDRRHAQGPRPRARRRSSAIQAGLREAPAGAVPGGWVNAAGKFVAKKLPDGNDRARQGQHRRPPAARPRQRLHHPTQCERLHHPGRRDGDHGPQSPCRTWGSSIRATRWS